jgi:hypothetical protein
MTVAFVGSRHGRPPYLTGLSDPDGGSVDVADGDWAFWFIYYPNVMTVAFDDPTGWTQLRKTVGTKGTVELWAYHWSTGDPTTWTITATGYNTPNPEGLEWFYHDESLLVVFRDLIADPTIISTTGETTAFPVTVPAISNAGIGNNDVTLVFAASDYHGPTSTGTTPAFDDARTVSGFGPYPGILIGWRRLTTAGAAPSVSVAGEFTTPTPTDVFGLQLILPDVSLGGWGVGQIRMGTN